MMFLEEPRIVARWHDDSCGTGEEWIRTSDGRVYKAMAGSTIRFEGAANNTGRSPKPRELNRHDRRRAAALARRAR